MLDLLVRLIDGVPARHLHRLERRVKSCELLARKGAEEVVVDGGDPGLVARRFGVRVWLVEHGPCDGRVVEA
jgi:hypothetical protein